MSNSGRQNFNVFNFRESFEGLIGVLWHEP
jgi:hypothetical protein